MIRDNVNLQLAERYVARYCHKATAISVLGPNGGNGRNIDEFLQNGIEAYRWLCRAEETLREASYEGLFDFSSDVHEAFDALYLAWLKTSELAEPWIEVQRKEALPNELFHEYRQVRESIDEVVAQRDWAKQSRESLEARLAEEPW